MKKFMILMSVFVLAACGGGSGGHSGGETVVSAVEIPQQRVSVDVADNENITGMYSSVNNVGEMTVAVENAIGSDLLTEISSDLDGMANSIRNYSNRNLSDRRNSSGGALHHIDGNLKSQTAFAFLEYARRFRHLDANNRRSFIREHPEHHHFIIGWGKLFCGCNNINDYSNDQLLDLFNNPANQERFDDFYSEYQYREFLLDNVRFSTLGFSNGEPDDERVKLVVNSDTGVITGLQILGDDDEVLETVERNQDANGNYLDTFSNVGYKYKIEIDGWEYPYLTDSFSNTNISKADLRAKIVNALDHEEGCNEYCRNTILAAFDNDEGRWVEQKANISYDLQGKNNGLRYSDFGYMTMVLNEFDGEPIPEEEQEPDHTVIVGGFKAKQIDKSKFANETIDFRGTAIGAVAHYDSEDDEESKRITTNTNAATLHFENGNETLTMPFNDYYTVTVNKNESGATVAFTDYPATSDAGFKFNKESNISQSNGDLVNVKIDYYGNANKPVEVSGGVSYEEHNSGLTSFESAFGMIRQQ